MRSIIIVLLIVMNINLFSQELEIITAGRSTVKVRILDHSSKQQLLTSQHVVQDNSLRKQFTARTFRLADNRLIIELYDRQALLVNTLEDFKKLEEVRFVKNIIWNLRKNISYKIELTYEEGLELKKSDDPNWLPQFKSEFSESPFEVFRLSTGQILFLNHSASLKYAVIYPDLKTLAAENTTVQEQYYGFTDDEYLMKRLAEGDELQDFEPNQHFIYPSYVNRIIQSHELKLVEQRVFVNDSYGNLYLSGKGYYVLIDEENQETRAGNKLAVLDLRIYPTMEAVRESQRKYEQFKQGVAMSQPTHFYQELSDKYGEYFIKNIPALIDSLPAVLNFDKEQLSIDEKGLEIIDESLKWNGTDFSLFDHWFPSVLAYYGQFFIASKNQGKWNMKWEKERKVWIPQVVVGNKPAFDSNEFYKSMYEGPIPLKWAGDFDQRTLKLRVGK